MNKVLILDEIHAYDVYTSSLICKLLEVCKLFGVRVVLMSATLTKGLKEKYVSAYTGRSITLKNMGYPLITTYENEQVDEFIIEGSERVREYSLEQVDILNEIDEQANLIYSSYVHDLNIIVYKNTVKEAQKLYDKLRSMGVDGIVLCHSRFIARDRIEKEELVCKLFGKDRINRPLRYIVIATQVLEACLDLDFDVCFTDIAPIDIIAQRLGRVCRFEGYDTINRGKLYVFISKEAYYGDSSYIYAELFLKATENYLNGRESLRLPDMLRNALEFVYGAKEYTTEDEIYALFTQVQKEAMEENLALKNVINISDKEFKVVFTKLKVSTRLTDSKTVVVLDKTESLGYNIKSLTDEQYKEVMLHSFNCSKIYLDDSLCNTDGRLRDKYILIMNDGSCIYNNKRYNYSSEKGFVVEKV